jgi:hypothetical protein
LIARRLISGSTADTYRLQVITRFFNREKLTKDPHTIEYAQPLPVVS